MKTNFTVNDLMILKDEAFYTKQRFINKYNWNTCYTKSKIYKSIDNRYKRRIRLLEKKINDNAKNKGGRPKLKDKKMPINVKLPPYLILWMDTQTESRAILIEKAINNMYKIK